MNTGQAILPPVRAAEAAKANAQELGVTNGRGTPLFIASSDPVVFVLFSMAKLILCGVCARRAGLSVLRPVEIVIFGD